ncbi:PREDICTED: uncharacterized protein LOC105560807 [Vollenhovia emeryi]|uniref:uncharacterized protein LOC105560807 n=1 Tax=Vollenhovia emeryi TaxID=411798 RepID=UPI0005F55B01|nr:PREDICTED: uncharacterized protein LOC105560807 [Vollenhovia emeryi]
MTGNVRIAASLVLLVAELTLGDVADSVSNCKDPCSSLCEKTPVGLPNSVYVKSCCQRGCRFFNLVDLRYEWERSSLNDTRNACEASCSEAYANLIDRYVCNTGCNSMARQRISDLLSLLTVAICTEESIDVSSTSPDIPENDILTDPGLRKELLPRWWDSDGFKLPQTHIKTIPMDARTMDYTLSSDYSGEARQAASTSKFESFQREFEERKDIPVFWKFMVFVCPRFFFCVCFFLLPMSLYRLYKDSPDKNMPYKDISWFFMIVTSLYHTFVKDNPDKITPYENINSSSDFALFIPDDAVMYKVPPPKYSESFGHAI